jgi:hypothetical protein
MRSRKRSNKAVGRTAAMRLDFNVERSHAAAIAVASASPAAVAHLVVRQ